MDIYNANQKNSNTPINNRRLKPISQSSRRAEVKTEMPRVPMSSSRLEYLYVQGC